MAEAHARLGPSNHRWPHCPGSVREEERYPDIAGEDAIDGTGSHLLLELCLQNNVHPAQYDQQIIGANHPDNPGGWLVSIDRIERVQMALNYITRRVAELKEMYPDCTVAVESEQRSDPGGAFGRGDWWGTVDITIIARHKMTGEVYFVEVADYKDGRGYVTEKFNTQLISYLFGKLRPYIATGETKTQPFNMSKVGGCRMTIIQPKTNPVIRYQCSTRPEDGINPQVVMEHAEKLADAANATDDPNAPLTPGKHCQWCKANPKRGGHCSAETDKSMEVVQNMNTEMVTTGDDTGLLEYISKAVADVKSLTPEQLSQLADAEAGFQAAFNKVKDEIEDRIKQGIQVPGYAMRPSRGSNVWAADEETIVKKLKGCRLKQADIYPPKLITPAAALKLEKLSDVQKKRIESELITFKAGSLKLAKVSHDQQSEKVVAQSDTDGLQSKSVDMMFAGVPKQEAAEDAAPSFF